MFDFTYTEEQLALRRLVRDFVQKEVAPVSLERDKIPDPKEAIPWDIIEKANAIGLRTLPLAEKYGGGGANSQTIAMVIEELAYGDMGVAVLFHQTWKWVLLIQELATEDQIERHLIPWRDDPRGMIALAFTEPVAGSDNLLPCLDVKAGMKTTAVPDGDHYVLNGMKHFISNAYCARLYLIFARTDLTKPITEGASLFLVPRDTPGLSIGRVDDKVGQRLADNAEIILENVRVPKEDLVGEWNKAMVSRERSVRHSHAFEGATCVGPAQRAFEMALDWAKTRIQGAKPIIQHPNIAIRLGEMWTAIQACRLMYSRVAWSADNFQYFDTRLFNVVNPFCAESLMKITLDAMQIFGGYGMDRSLGIEKLMRDASTFLHSGGLNEILYMAAGNRLGREPYPRDWLCI